VNLPPALARAKFLLLTPEAFWSCLQYKILLTVRPVSVLNQLAPAVRAHEGWPSASDISRAVYFSSRFLPATLCLPQALAVRSMMHRYGKPCELRIGVATDGQFRAHAWVTTGEKVVHGHTADSYTTLERPVA
jgi:Transglutaminase-like superfamily